MKVSVTFPPPLRLRWLMCSLDRHRLRHLFMLTVCHCFFYLPPRSVPQEFCWVGTDTWRRPRGTSTRRPGSSVAVSRGWWGPVSRTGRERCARLGSGRLPWSRSCASSACGRRHGPCSTGEQPLGGELHRRDTAGVCCNRCDEEMYTHTHTHTHDSLHSPNLHSIN